MKDIYERNIKSMVIKYVYIIKLMVIKYIYIKHLRGMSEINPKFEYSNSNFPNNDSWFQNIQKTL